jgi:malate/lactate dehydrogenase
VLALHEKRLRDRKPDPARSTSDQAHTIHANRIVLVTTTVIIGAGDLGGAVAQHLAAADVMSSVTLVDEGGTVAEGKALDIRHAAAAERFSTVVSGTTSLDAVLGAAFVVIADRSGTQTEWQDDSAVALIGRVARLNQAAPIVCAGATQAVVIERVVRELGLPRARIFGSAPEGFRSAVTAVAALEASCAAPDVSLTVVGRPSNQIIVPWEDASIAGRRATSVLSVPALSRLEGRLAKLWPPGPLTLAAAASRAIVAALSRTPRTICAFVSLTRDEGSLGRVAMLPVTLSPRGIASIVAPTLSIRDQVRLESALR